MRCPIKVIHHMLINIMSYFSVICINYLTYISIVSLLYVNYKLFMIFINALSIIDKINL